MTTLPARCRKTNDAVREPVSAGCPGATGSRRTSLARIGAGCLALGAPWSRRRGSLRQRRPDRRGGHDVRGCRRTRGRGGTAAAARAPGQWCGERSRPAGRSAPAVRRPAAGTRSRPGASTGPGRVAPRTRCTGTSVPASGTAPGRQRGRGESAPRVRCRRFGGSARPRRPGAAGRAASRRAACCSAAAAAPLRRVWACRRRSSCPPGPAPGARCPWTGSCRDCGRPRPAPARPAPRARRARGLPSAAAAPRWWPGRWPAGRSARRRRWTATA